MGVIFPLLHFLLLPPSSSSASVPYPVTKRTIRGYSGGGEGTLSFVWTKLKNKVPYCVRVPEFGGLNDMAFNMVTGNLVVHF